MQTQSMVTLKKLGGAGSDDGLAPTGGEKELESDNSPTLAYGRIQSRFNFAHSVDPIKKETSAAKSVFKFGFGCAPGAGSDVDRDEIMVPMKVQEFIHRSIRTLSNSMSNRSPDDGYRGRDESSSLVPVEEIEAELEQKWFTLEERT